MPEDRLTVQFDQYDNELIEERNTVEKVTEMYEHNYNMLLEETYKL